MQNEIVNLQPDKIVPNLYQPRKFFDEDAIEELAQSIKEHGIIQPLSVRKIGQTYELVAGERRLRAAKKIGLEFVPVIIIDISDKESAAIALLENLQREDLNYIEEAEAYFNLIKEHSYTQEKLAETIGKKQSTIANKLRILKLSEKVRSTLLENGLTERHARALLKLDSEEEQIRILSIVIDKGLNVKETENLIEKELTKNILKDKKNKIKGIFTSKVYINTIKQVFDKYGISAQYRSKELDDCIEVTIKIPKSN
ncbi:nucleoid occlusion protein [Clostridium sp. 19966]|uniref:nucleoid occlusion protein n=1 Tax=Clostridium sp. 19966 TaxID=2768166 RepID=UPI0028DFD2B8|nr:nucleoid occlusion protein [Clostridium sp. 19966]MDT8719508.1 nucleoid occlusion protein [Clostridium sp. 19966]